MIYGWHFFPPTTTAMRRMSEFSQQQKRKRTKMSVKVPKKKFSFLFKRRENLFSFNCTRSEWASARETRKRWKIFTFSFFYIRRLFRGSAILFFTSGKNTFLHECGQIKLLIFSLIAFYPLECCYKTRHIFFVVLPPKKSSKNAGELWN
jgi:hypothetical protein